MKIVCASPIHEYKPLNVWSGARDYSPHHPSSGGVSCDIVGLCEGFLSAWSPGVRHLSVDVWNERPASFVHGNMQPPIFFVRPLRMSLCLRSVDMPSAVPRVLEMSCACFSGRFLIAPCSGSDWLYFTSDCWFARRSSTLLVGSEVPPERWGAQLFTAYLDGLTCELRIAAADCHASDHLFVETWRRRSRYEEIDSIFTQH